MTNDMMQLQGLLEESTARLARRNGYRERDWQTRVGAVELHSTNPIERLNHEIKRRTEVLGIFPNEAAIRRLVGAILLEQIDEWVVQRARYMPRDTLNEVLDQPVTDLPAVAH